MSADAFLIERARKVAGRLDKARCWHESASTTSKISTKWWDLLPADVAEAALRLRELADQIESESAA